MKSDAEKEEMLSTYLSDEIFPVYI